MAKHFDVDMAKRIVYQGKFLQMVEQDGWEYVARHSLAFGLNDVVIVIPVMKNGSVVFISQHRKPINNTALEFPAGLVGDVREDESELDAARTELFEETGLVADKLEYLTCGPTSAGLTNETIIMYLATGCEKKGTGGGDEHEEIDVHEIPAENVEVFVEHTATEGISVDPKVFAGLYFLKQRGLLP